MHGLEAEYTGMIDFVYLDIDDIRNDAFKRQLGFSYQPHLFLLDESGAVVGQWVGAVDGDVLRDAFDALLH